MGRRYCSASPTCRTLTDGGPCPACRRKRDAQRGGGRARGYDTRWERFAAAWIAQHPACGERMDYQRHAEHSACVRRGQRTPATVVDHIVGLRAGGAHCDPRNSQSLCGACNRRKAIAEEGAFNAVR